MIALAMIVADFEPLDMLARCLYSAAPYVDGIFITLNGKTDKETKKAKELRKAIDTLCLTRKYPPVTFSYTKWEKDFSKARNFNFNQVPKEYDFILWLDTDDLLRGGKNLKTIAEEALQKGFGAVFFNYLYKVQMDPNTMKITNVLIEHLRERLIRNDGSYKWIAPIHETLIPQRETNQTDSQLCDVVHMSTDERGMDALNRNVTILEDQLAGQGTRQDPRTIYYLAKCYFDMRTPEYWQKSEDLIFKYLNGSETNTPSGWAEERAQAWEYLSEIYRDRGHTNKAIKAVANSLIEDPKFPNFYIDMAMVYMYAKDWKKAKHWALLGQQVPYPKTTLVLNPRDMQVRTLEVLFNVATNTNNLEEAWACATKLAELLPDQDYVINRAKALTSARENNEIAKKFLDVAKYLYDKNEVATLEKMVDAIPQELRDEPIMMDFRRSYTPVKKWSENEITILCGRGFEKWSPKSIDKGIGGSEEAVIYLSKELTKLGWQVTVYGDPQDDAGIYDGVLYEPYYKFNPRDEFNILIGWRNIGMFDNQWNAKKTFLWLHDIQNDKEYTPERLDRITKIFALSKWHRDNMPSVPDEKFVITGNGINLEMIDTTLREKIERKPFRCFYGSSYDRGLEHLLKIWGDVKKAVPEAELRICYGWNLFESFYKDNPERMAWKAKMDELMTQDGITHLGRVSQAEVLREAAGAGIWAYPTHFGEISCINAMKNQAMGAIPVVCDYAALKETAKYGIKIPVKDGEDIYDPDVLEEYKKELIKAMDKDWQDKIRPEMMEWARRFSWSNVAEQWSDEFKRDELKEASDVLLEHDPKLEKYLPVQLQKKYGYQQTY